MPKGRHFTPSKDRDGIWFHHLSPRLSVASTEEGRDVSSPCDPFTTDASGVGGSGVGGGGGGGVGGGGGGSSKKLTTTGKMQMDPFNPATNYYPPQPPPKFKCMEIPSHDFSKHDNRQVFQGHGVYFGNGRDTRFLGKKMGKTFEERPHFTEPDFLTHYGRLVTECDYNTIYADNYRGCPLSAADMKAFRRHYPRAYPALSADRSSRCEDCGVFRETRAPLKASLETLTLSQQPYPKDTGRWKYSYHGIPRSYPILDTNPGCKLLSAFPVWNVQGPTVKKTCSSAFV